MSRPMIGLGVFVWKDGKFLVGKRVGAHGRGTWSIPGGHLEFGESLEEGAEREVIEETGLAIENISLLAVTNDIFESENKHSVTIWIRSDLKSGEPEIREPDKFVDLTWRTFQTLPSPLLEPCWTNLRKARPDLFGKAGQQM